MKREPRRWMTPFGKWVSHYGVTRLTTSLASLGQPVRPKTIYGWVAGDIVPREPRAKAIVEIAEGAVGIDDVYAQRDQLRQHADTAVPGSTPGLDATRRSRTD